MQCPGRCRSAICVYAMTEHFADIKQAVLINGEIEYRPIKPMVFEEISHSASRRSDKAFEQAFYAAMEKMMKHIETDPDYRYIFR